MNTSRLSLIDFRSILPALCMFMIVFFISSSHAMGATYYVATNGNDSSGTGTSANPWRTVNYSLAQLSNNDVLRIKPGTYTETSTLTINNSGVTITADDQNNMPVVQKTSEGVLRINSGADNVEVSYLILDNGNRRGSYWYGIVYIMGAYAHIHHNEIRDGWIGIEIRGGHSHEINNNNIHNFGTSNTNPESGSGFGIIDYNSNALSWNEKIYIHHNDIYDAGGDSFQCENSGGNYFEIAYNDLHSNGEDAIDIKYCDNIRLHNNDMRDNAGDGFVGHSNKPASNVEIYSNRIYNNGWWGLFLGGVSNLDVYNNLIYNNAKSTSYDMYHTYGVQGGSGRFHHNVVYNNGTSAGSKNHGGYNSSMVTSNNVFYNNSGSKGNIYTGSGGTISYNYVYPTSPGITGSNAITSSNPGFVNAASGNFNLLSNSPLINAGIDAGITTDFQNNVRPAGGGFDIGAYEFGGSSGDYVAPDPPTNIQVVLN